MSNECIHGLDGGLCASCYPKAAPVIVSAAPAARAGRARPGTRAPSLRSSPSPLTVTVRVPKSVRSATVTKSVLDNVGEQRIYHLTHLSNLAGILASGCLLADASEAWTARPTVDISSARTRQARRSALVAGPDSRSVAGYVPFFLSPNARLWDGLLTDADDPRLSRDAHGSEIYDFVLLVSTVRKLREAQARGEQPGPVALAVADGDAADDSTRFGATPEASDTVLRRLRAGEGSGAILDAELLVEESFPVELITLVGVANDRVRDVVRGLLATSTHRPKVAVYPPWFHAAEETAAP